MSDHFHDHPGSTPRGEISEAERRRRAKGWLHLNRALSSPDADSPVISGEWAGFTRGRAIAWCWNLCQYEPHGFVHPASELRARRIAVLEAGGIPDGFGYADRARALEAAGFSPAEYRNTQERLGRPTFSPTDVTFR